MASSYVNDLRLNEMATGDASGTWGETTNTNLELIAEAFSYGTEAITTNADTHTTTIADGATDPGRALYLKYTGTLDSACTITIGPNTVSKVWIIENGTSGSQDIILSQGSGANITIPAGDTKVVYSDGAGAGAAFFDAFASLSVVDLKVQDDLTVTGDIDVDGTTNLDVVDIDGAVDMASTALVTGVLTANGGAVFNETGADVDFRVESDTVDHALFVQGSDGFVGIGTASPAFKLEVESSSDADLIQIQSTASANNTVLRLGISGDVATLNASGDSTGALAFKTYGTERLRIDSAGTLFQGTTSPTLHSSSTGIVFENGSLLTDVTRGAGKSITLAQNAATDSGNTWTYLATDEASYYQQFGGNHYFSTAASGSAGADVTFDTKLFISNSGNVGIGTTSPTSGGGLTLSSSTTAEGFIEFKHTVDGDSGFIGNAKALIAGATTNQLGVRGGTNGIAFSAGSTERFRIASNARLTINGSATANAHCNLVGEVGAANRAMSFENTVGGGEIGTVTTGASSTSYNTTSDYRLKENVVTDWDATTRLKQLKPSRFNFIVDADRTVDGFLAHEVQEIVPEAITGTKDAMQDEEYEVTPAVLDDDGNVVTEAVMGTRSVPDYQGIDQSKLVPLLTKALQEALTKIEQLETRLETLENA
jgi:hypothetical protein